MIHQRETKRLSGFFERTNAGGDMEQCQLGRHCRNWQRRKVFSLAVWVSEHDVENSVEVERKKSKWSSSCST